MTARGPDTPSQAGKWSLEKVNKRREHINGGSHVERVASDPHFTQLRAEQGRYLALICQRLHFIAPPG